MPYTMLPTTEDIISDILNLVALRAADRWANVLKSSSVKGNVERSGVTFGNVR
jgi:hypothetical protein